MTSNWLIYDVEEKQTGVVISGFDTKTPVHGKVKWTSNNRVEELKLASRYRKFMPYSFENYVYYFPAKFLVQLKSDLGEALKYWIASRTLLKLEVAEQNPPSRKVPKNYSFTSDFISVIDSFEIDKKTYSVTKARINSALKDLLDNGQVRLISEEPKLYEYCGDQTLQSLWPGEPISFEPTKAKLDVYLKSKIQSFLLSGDKEIPKDFCVAMASDGAAPDFFKYAADIWGGTALSQATDAYVKNEPIVYVEDVVTALKVLAEVDRGDSHKKRQAIILSEPLVRDFLLRPPSLAINARLLKSLKGSIRKLFGGTSSYLNSLSKPELRIFSHGLLEGAKDALIKNYLDSDTDTDRIEALACIQLFSANSKVDVDVASFDLKTVLKAYLLFEEKSKDFSDLGGNVYMMRNLLQGSVLNALQNEAVNVEEINEMEALRSRLMQTGPKSGTFAEKVALELFALNSNELERPSWWESLSLTDIYEFLLHNPKTVKSVIMAEKTGGFLGVKVQEHAKKSRSIDDLLCLLQIQDWFSAVGQEELAQAWKRVSQATSWLQELTDELLKTPLEEAERKAESRMKAAEAVTHSERLKFMNEISELTQKIATLESAFRRGQEALGGNRIGLELAVSRKYAEGIAKLIRRLERESGEKPFSEIIAREEAGLSRLGISLLNSKDSQSFDPAIHDSVGQVIQLGASVTILETGVLLSHGDDSITLMKAVVRTAE